MPVGRDWGISAQVFTLSTLPFSLSLQWMKYGSLLVCCKTESGNALCIARGLKFLFSQEGDPIMNELGCSSLVLTRTVFAIKSSAILKAVSVDP